MVSWYTMVRIAYNYTNKLLVIVQIYNCKNTNTMDNSRITFNLRRLRVICNVDALYLLVGCGESRFLRSYSFAFTGTGSAWATASVAFAPWLTLLLFAPTNPAINVSRSNHNYKDAFGCSSVTRIPTEEVGGDLPDLNLFRTLRDPVPAVVAVDVLKRLVPRVTHATVDLQGPVGVICGNAH